MSSARLFCRSCSLPLFFVFSILLIHFIVAAHQVAPAVDGSETSLNAFASTYHWVNTSISCPQTVTADETMVCQIVPIDKYGNPVNCTFLAWSVLGVQVLCCCVVLSCLLNHAAVLTFSSSVSTCMHIFLITVYVTRCLLCQRIGPLHHCGYIPTRIFLQHLPKFPKTSLCHDWQHCSCQCFMLCHASHGRSDL